MAWPCRMPAPGSWKAAKSRWPWCAGWPMRCKRRWMWAWTPSARVDAHASLLRERLRGIRGVTVHDLGPVCSGLVSFNIDGWMAADVSQALALQGINTTANGVPYTPLDMRARGLHSVARASVSYLTTPAEIDRLAAAVGGLARR